MTRLSCRPSDALQWNIPTEGSLFFQFDLGLEDPFFPIDDEMHFQALTLALAKFSTEVWPSLQERTTGAILYQGSADFSAQFTWGERQQQNWDAWREERPPASEPHLRRLFCADAFAHYFQLLAHRLPDELPLHIFLDAAGLGTLAETHQILSRTRFEHFQVAVKGLPSFNGPNWEGARSAAPIAVCFPEERYCTDAVLQQLDAWMAGLTEPFRVIHEGFLTEEWEGVDILHVLPEALSPQGERKLKGFLAAGGVISDLCLKK
jgi:hypothetical protein